MRHGSFDVVWSIVSEQSDDHVYWLYLSSEIRRVVKVVGTKIVSTWLTDTRGISTCARKSWYLFYFLSVRRRAFLTVKCTVSHRTSYIIEPGKAANVVQLPFITYWYWRQAVTFNYYRIETFWLDQWTQGNASLTKMKLNLQNLYLIIRILLLYVRIFEK